MKSLQTKTVIFFIQAKKTVLYYFLLPFEAINGETVEKRLQLDFLYHSFLNFSQYS